MIIRIPVRFEGAKGEKILNTVFTSEVDLSCIHPDHIRNIVEPTKLGRPLEAIKAGTGELVQINECVVVDFYIDNIRLSDEFMVTPKMSEEVVIGDATIRKWRMKLDFEQDKVIVRPRTRLPILPTLKFYRRVG